MKLTPAQRYVIGKKGVEISRLTVVSRVAKKNSPRDTTESLFMRSKTTKMQRNKTNLSMNTAKLKSSENDHWCFK